jgi:hypothetical protein
MWIISFLIDVQLYTINLENNQRMPTLESALDGGDHVHNKHTILTPVTANSVPICCVSPMEVKHFVRVIMHHSY